MLFIFVFANLAEWRENPPVFRQVMGVPPVRIRFRLGFPILNHPANLGYPIVGKTTK